MLHYQDCTLGFFKRFYWLNHEIAMLPKNTLHIECGSLSTCERTYKSKEIIQKYVFLFFI